MTPRSRPGGSRFRTLFERSPLGYFRGLPQAVGVLALGQFLTDAAGKITVSFLPLYLAVTLHASTGVIGVVLACPPFFGVLGQALGGAVIDRVGRRAVLVFSIASEALMLLGMAFSRSIALFAILNAGVGLLASAYWPASQVVVADATKPEERVPSFTFLYLATNVGAATGPLLGAVLAITHHRLAFGAAALMLAAYGALVLTKLPRPDLSAPVRAKQFGAGYSRALRHRALRLFVAAIFLSELAAQMNLSLFLVRMHVHHATSVLGAFMSMNGLVVVLTSIFIARSVQNKNPSRVIAAGSVLYALTLPCFIFARSVLSVVAIDVPYTVAEVLLATVSPAVLAALAPERDRAAYMGVAAVSSTLGTALSPLATGLGLQVLSPGAVLGLLAVLPLAAAIVYLRAGSKTPVSIPVDAK